MDGMNDQNFLKKEILLCLFTLTGSGISKIIPGNLLNQTTLITFGEDMSNTFPIVIIGTLEDSEICVPFMGPGDASAYIESLSWAMTKLQVIMDLKILQNGTEIGMIKSTKEDAKPH